MHYTTTFCYPVYTCLFVAHKHGPFLRKYMHVCNEMVIYLEIKTPQSRKESKYTWQKNAGISCCKNVCKYTWENPHVYRVIITRNDVVSQR